ncbi:PQQ-dependent sugar dehydrogenase [Caldimonas sp. KR1-144]|uniref:PQQ-dependent sugar dehydrogenase n=1 Tax=Caldimonas sp. KR1-144 TaxID=3400911 RepID=UPI003C0F1E14
MTRRRQLLLALGAAALGPTPARAQRPDGPAPTEARIETRTLARGLANPWSIACLPDGRLLVTERPGRLRVVASDGALSRPVTGLPPVLERGQGGLLDVVLAPDFASSGWIYWSFAEAGNDGPGGPNGTSVARSRLDLGALALRDVQVLFRQQPRVDSSLHFGSRLVFAPDGRLWVTLGDRGSRRDDAQRLDNDLGKVLRLDSDGRAAPGNPYKERAVLWSHGHRNVQGAALHPHTGELWTHEHGPQGGDELNADLAGRNYGWPQVTWGREYVSGLRIGEGTSRADVEPAVHTWVPSIAPSGLAFLTSDRYGPTPRAPQASAFVGALKARALVRLDLDGRRVLRETRYALDERVRDVRQSPDGWLLLATDDREDGRILRVERLG